MTTNEELLKAAIRHQVYLQRYTTSTVNQIIALINQYDDSIVEEIVKRDVGSQSFNSRRLAVLLEALREINKEAYTEATGALTTELKGLAVYEAGFQRRLIEGAVPVALGLKQPGARHLYSEVRSQPFEGLLLKEWYQDLGETAHARVQGVVRMGFREGRATGQIVRDVRGTRAQQYKDGILEINRRSTEKLVRTSINHTATVARDETYKENADVIKAWQFVATLDSRTSKICASLDGKTYPLGTGPKPPRHINCRSSTAPVLKSWKEMGIRLGDSPEGTRASMNGQVAGAVTYGDWLRGQPVSVQDQVLGQARGRLFRKGGLSVDKFVDERGEVMTLDELRRVENDAFERAGI